MLCVMKDEFPQELKPLRIAISSDFKGLFV